MAFTLDSLKNTVKSFQDKKSTNTGEWPSCTFLPEGNHKLRFITDPKDEVFVEYYSYGYFARGVRDPKNDTGVPENFVNELETLYTEHLQPRNKWAYGSKYNILAYVWLYETDTPSENWQPGNLYVIIANKKFADSYVAFLGTLAKDAPEEILKTLNPQNAGVILSVAFKGGRDGGCSIGAAFPTKMGDPINLEGKPYIPLELAYIRPGFNKEKYDALVKKYKEDIAKLDAIAGAVAGGAASSTAESTQASIPSSVGQSMIGAQTSVQSESAQQAATETKAEEPAAQQADSTPPFEPDTKPAADAAPVDDPWAKFKK